MLTCHDSGEVTDIHISGILDEPVNIRKLAKAEASDLFVPNSKIADEAMEELDKKLFNGELDFDLYPATLRFAG